MSDNNHYDDINKSNSSDDQKEYEDICYICRRPESKVGKMIHIPQNICICNDCMQKTFDTMNKGDNPYLNFMNINPNMPNMGMNFNEIPKNQKLKKKKPKEDQQEVKEAFDVKKIPSPHIIKGQLDDYVIGQDHAKKVISVAVYNPMSLS